ncbi:MAG: DNA polymerase III subunit gamma/tau [Elusimicrobia bacterium]|nr:DNA polymerase III subunit gamma/tau [Elusimicrobiota bacterium]
MAYLVIARKYRPQKFGEVVGQEHITKTLQNAIRLDKISHAYLFTGPRGIGKTTTARILAKAVNCPNIKNEEPCNICTSCKEITNSESVDIIEIDAASNRGIDEIRELRKNVKFSPSSAKYKVYIIDEVHMLTKEAFNAILKTLEEPPSHVIFIMATTEPEKVLDTITSRCQTFSFRLITEKEIRDALKKIADKEKAEYDEEVLWTIAKASGGSMRDAESIMDQAMSFSPGRIDGNRLNELLGLIPREFLFKYTQMIKGGDMKGALELNNDLVKKGYSLNRLFGDLNTHFRNIMFAKVFGGSLDFMGFNKEYSQKLADASGGFSKEQLVWIMEFLTKNMARIKYADNPHVVMDTVMFKLCQKYVGFDDIMEKIGAPEKNEPDSAAGGESGDSGNSSPGDDAAEDVVEEAGRKKPKKGGKWETIMSLVMEESPTLYHTLKESSASLDGKKIKVVYRGNLDLPDRQKNLLALKVKEVMGEGYYINIIKEAREEAAEEKPKAAAEPKKNVITPSKIESEEPVIGEIVDLFDGKIER